MSIELAIMPVLGLGAALISLFTSGDKLKNPRVLYGLLALNLATCGFAIYFKLADAKSSNQKKLEDAGHINKLETSVVNLSSALAAFRDETSTSLRTLEAALQGLGWSTTRNASISAALTSIKADKARAALAAGTPVAARTGITVVYFPKDVDATVVEGALRALGFTLRRGPTQVPDVPTNAVWFGEQVPLEAAKLAALTLMRAGVQIKAIRRFRDGGGAKARLIQIGADRAIVSWPVLTPDQVTNATSFPSSN